MVVIRMKRERLKCLPVLMFKSTQKPKDRPREIGRGNSIFKTGVAFSRSSIPMKVSNRRSFWRILFSHDFMAGFLFVLFVF